MKVLITGGSGLIGKEISQQLLNKGHEVRWLSRQPGSNSLNIKEYKWDTDKEIIDLEAFEGVDTIINLAGAPIDSRWTPSYKSEIIRSRVDSVRLLYTTIEKNNLPVKTFISASAVGYYPHDYEKEFTEESAPGSDFLSLVCQKWEQEVQHVKSLGIRTARCRIGIVLSNNGGALPQIVKPIKFGLGAPLGNGKQWMPWVHLRDVAGIFVFIAENDKLSGVFNAVGPYNVTNAELTKAAAKVLDKPLILPKVPETVLKIALGDMAKMVLISNKVSNKKISEAGYNYQFTDLNAALEDLLK